MGDFMEYENCCGSCINFMEADGNHLYDEKTNASYVKGYCTWYQVYYYPDDKCSAHYEEKKESTSACYITTIVCDRMGFKDDCFELETLRNFRRDVLQKNEQYKSLLFEYDAVGPLIAKKLQTEDLSLIRKTFYCFLRPIVQCIVDHKNEEAIQKYRSMTCAFADYYAIPIISKVPGGYDYSVGGHGNHKEKKFL